MNILKEIMIIENSGSVVQMEWIGDYFLAILFESGMLILWDSKDNKIIWRKDFKQEEIGSFQINPFDPNHAVLASSLGWIYFTTGILPEKRPEILSKYRITPPETTGGKAQQTPQKALKQMIFSPSHRNLIYFILHKEILVFDLSVNLVSGKGFN